MKVTLAENGCYMPARSPAASGPVASNQQDSGSLLPTGWTLTLERETRGIVVGPPGQDAEMIQLDHVKATVTGCAMVTGGGRAEGK